MCFILNNLDLETIGLTKEEFINIIIENKIFSILSDIFVEENEEDKDFLVWF